MQLSTEEVHKRPKMGPHHMPTPVALSTSIWPLPMHAWTQRSCTTDDVDLDSASHFHTASEVRAERTAFLRLLARTHGPL